MPSHSLTRTDTYAGDGVLNLSDTSTVSKTAGLYVELSESYVVDDTDVPTTFTMDVSEMKLLLITAVGGSYLIESNDNVGSEHSLAVAPGTPISWAEGDVGANPWLSGGDITGLFVTNTDSLAGTLNIRVLYDPTP